MCSGCTRSDDIEKFAKDAEGLQKEIYFLVMGNLSPTRIAMIMKI